jgi:hypothetical protein
VTSAAYLAALEWAKEADAHAAKLEAAAARVHEWERELQRR